MLHVDEGTNAAHFLGFCDDVLSQGRFSGGLRAKDLGYSSARNPTDAQGQIQGN
jgi:hypothetical protein